MTRAKIFIIIIVSLVFFTACKDKDVPMLKEINKTNIDVYYVNQERTKLVTETISISEDNTEKQIEEVISSLINGPKDKTLKKSLPDNVVINDVIYDANNQIRIVFDSNYLTLTSTDEILCRAAIVKTLTQINNIQLVEFYINDQPLIGADEKPVGLMSPNDFVVNPSSLQAEEQQVSIKLYFANSTGDNLIEEDRSISIEPNTTLEQLVLEQLINGPTDTDLVATIPKDTKVYKVYVKDGICYLDLSEQFISKEMQIKEELTVYSVVNSLIELPNVNKVQFFINGKKQETYREKIRFDGLFDRNLDLIKN